MFRSACKTQMCWGKELTPTKKHANESQTKQTHVVEGGVERVIELGVEYAENSSPEQQEHRVRDAAVTCAREGCQRA